MHMLMCNSLDADGTSGDLVRGAMQSMSDLLSLELLLTEQVSDKLLQNHASFMATPMFDHCAYLESKDIDRSAGKKLLTRARQWACADFGVEAYVTNEPHHDNLQ